MLNLRDHKTQNAISFCSVFVIESSWFFVFLPCLSNFCCIRLRREKFYTLFPYLKEHKAIDLNLIEIIEN